MADSRPIVFLCYAKEDIARARPVYEGLKTRGLRVWFDDVDLRPGDEWRPAITKAIARSRFFLICLSEAALRKTGEEPGFQDRELTEAYQIAMSQSPENFAIVPARLEDCGRGDHRLSIFQQYDLFPNDSVDARLDALAVQFGGTPMAKVILKDERSEDERLLHRLLTRAEASNYANDPAKALRLLDDILQLNPTIAAAHHLRACILERLDRFNEALQAYTQAVTLDPLYAAAYNNRGFLHMWMGTLNEAEKDYNRAMELNPTEPLLFLNRATVRAAAGDADTALEDMARAITLDPKRALLFKTRGEIIHHLGQDPRAAIADFTRAIDLEPDYRDAYFKRAVALEDSGDLAAALRDYSKALDLEETAVAYSNRALVYHQLGMNDRAVADLEAALQVDPEDEVSQRALAEIQGMVQMGIFLAQFPDLSSKLSPDSAKRMGLEPREKDE
jgi:tetratricopeptide (TPR) repeat protein